MISIEDCIAMSGLTHDEVGAIAEHEHIEQIAAAALASSLMSLEGGPAKIRNMIHEDVRAAIAHGDKAHARELVSTMRHFINEHPESVRFERD